MDETHLVRLDDLRRYAAGLGSAAGLARDRAAALAGHLLWYDAAGVPEFGIQALPGWLDQLERGDIDPRAEGTVGHEHPSVAVLDGGNGLPPLILARAAAVAVEKSREVGVGVVRVGNVRPIGSAAEIAAEVAVGPTVAVVLGPRPSWTLALPTSEGLPAVFDTDLDAAARRRLAPGNAGKKTRNPANARPAWADLLGPWASALAPEGGWIVLTLAVAALESLVTFQERATTTLAEVADTAPGTLKPGPWDAHRRKAREHGIPLTPETRAALRRHAQRLGVEPVGG